MKLHVAAHKCVSSERHSVRCNRKDKHMARITQLASVAIGLMTQGILLSIVIGA